MSNYEVLEDAEILGTMRTKGEVIELPDADALPLVDAKVIAPKAPEAASGAGAATPSSKPSAEAAAAAPSTEAPKKEEKPGFVGGHVVGGNEPPGPNGTLRKSGLTPEKK